MLLLLVWFFVALASYPGWLYRYLGSNMASAVLGIVSRPRGKNKKQGPSLLVSPEETVDISHNSVPPLPPTEMLALMSSCLELSEGRRAT